MAELEKNSTPSKFSRSSRRALDWAYTWSKVRGSEQVTDTDLLVGILQAHGAGSPPLKLLRLADLPPERVYQVLDFAPDKVPISAESFPGEDVLSQDGVGVIGQSLALAEQYNAAEDGLVRLRDLFGGVLEYAGPALKALLSSLEPAQIDPEALISAYRSYLSLAEDTDLSEFLAQQFPEFGSRREPSETIQLAASGFSADTRSGRDLVGIGAEVDAFAYLIAAKALQPPLAMGLFGDWGSGKTYYMQSLQERIHKVTRDARASKKPQSEISVFKHIVQIEFNAWHYVEGELWASLVEHIFQNLQTGAEEDRTILQQRQQHWIGELEKLRGQQGAAQALRLELKERLDANHERVERLTQKREEKLKQIDQLKGRDVIAAVSLQPDEQELVGELLNDLGVTDFGNTFAELMDALSNLKATLQRGNALTLVLRQRGWRWTLGLVLVIGIGPAISGLLNLLGEIEIPAVTNAMVSLSGFLGALTLLLRQGNSRLSAAINQVEAARASLESRRREVEGEYVQQIAAQEQELARVTAEYERALVEEQTLAGQIEMLEQELLQITPRRVLLDFIQERVGSEDYRRRLGVAALIRRDFDQLWQLIREQNREFIARDDGIEKEEDRHLINRVVLYIDDLDRCPPQRVVEVLQAVHLLLAFPLFVVVVAVDSRWLSQSLHKHYEDLLAAERLNSDSNSSDGPALQATPQDYLEKIFQIPFWVKPLSEAARERIVQGLVEESVVRERIDRRADGGDTLERLEGEGPDRVRWDKSSIAREFEVSRETNPNPPSLDIHEIELEFMEDLKPLLGLTPRSVKRFVNVYWLMKSIALSRSPSFVSEERFADFKKVLFLLAVLTGAPAISTKLFSMLVPGELVRTRLRMGASETGDTSSEFTLGDVIKVLRDSIDAGRGDREQQRERFERELGRLETWAKTQDNGAWLHLGVTELSAWAPQIARFSYRMEEI